MTEPTSERAELTDWATLSERSWPVLLIGNGMSVNLWNGFSYPSLHELAMLSPAATAVFDEIQTTNFEAALEVIHHAHVVAVALGRATREIDETYEAVKTALFDAVVGAHVPRDRIPQATKDSYAAELGSHSEIYTTNYDLVTYWTRLGSSQGAGIKDFFWQPDQTFNRADVDTSDPAFFYLHGAVHLWQDDHGLNGKWTYEAAGNLLSAADNYTPNSSRPLTARLLVSQLSSI
ncbi:DUF4917 family protein [Pseudactinotalea terrae]|uniref:DUF4917 family protein n=1 Tax=Pseudactinotalea terrae TaxID=1743262 RepID=UPI0012E0E956|nr:DUF4917 family protein [Pseudactinotalea terrae]